ncbi:MAG: hypothetical protein ABGZ36_05945 [Actinomycetota bacterium]
MNQRQQVRAPVEGVLDAGILGDGRFAEVRAGRETTLGRAVAVSLLRPVDDATRVRLDDQTARLAPLRDHPGLVGVLSSGTTDGGVPFVVEPRMAGSLEPGWQAKRRAKALAATELTPEQRAKRDAISREEKIRRQENSNIDAMMRIHGKIDEIVDDPETADALKPWYMLMCKRPCFDNDYLPAFNRPSVHLVDTRGKGITEIKATGPVFEGREYELDVLIYATGFEVQKTGIYNQIRGEAGVELNDKYKDGVRTLVGIHSHGYPNLFIMGGYQASFRFNLTDVLQIQGDHIAACIGHARQHGHHSMNVTAQAEEWWVQEVIANRGKTTRSEDCTPGYYNFEGESQRRQDGNYNGSYPQYIAHTEVVLERIEEHFTLGSNRTGSR